MASPVTLLALDVGNTNITLGLFAGRRLVHTSRVFTHRDMLADEYGLLFKDLLRDRGLNPSKVDGIALSSVVPVLTPVMEEVCRIHFGRDPLVITTRLNSGLRFVVVHANPTARELGADLLAAAVAAYAAHGGPAIVVDFGTATTLSGLDKHGTFLGVAIAPGLNISADALYTFAPHLPRVRLEAPPFPLGTTTVHSLQAGLLLGHAALVDGLVTRIKAQVGRPKAVVATGGLAPVVAPHCKSITTVEPDLVLEGIRLLWERNRPTATSKRRRR